MKYLPNIGRDHLPQLIAVVTATLSTICDGMAYGWPAPAIPALKRPDTPIEINETNVLWIELLAMFGGMVGLPITIFCVDRIGRKKSILLAACCCLTAWILTCLAKSIPVLYLGRFLSGLAGDVGYVTVPMYVAEIADKDIRGLLGSLPYFMSFTGVLLVYCLGPYVPLYVTAIVPICILVIQLCLFPFMPESPHYLLMKGRTDEARKSLDRLRNYSNIEGEFKEVEEAVSRQCSESGSWLDLFRVKSNLKAVIIMTILNGCQHFSSISALMMNLHSILGEADGAISENIAGIIVVSLMLLSLTTSGLLVDKLGRKTLLVVSSILTGITLLALATFLYFKQQGTDLSSYNWIPIVSVVCYALAFKSGLGLVPIVLTAELFPTNIKAYGMTWADAMFIFFATLSIYTFKTMENSIGMYSAFYLYAGCCFLTSIFVVLCVPETAGKSLEEIQQILKGVPKTEKNKESQEKP